MIDAGDIDDIPEDARLGYAFSCIPVMYWGEGRYTAFVCRSWIGEIAMDIALALVGLIPDALDAGVPIKVKEENDRDRSQEGHHPP